MYRSVRLVILILLPVVSYSQDSGKLLRDYFKNLRSGKNMAIPSKLVLSENAEGHLKDLQPYYHDSTSLIRSKAYEITSRIAIHSRLPEVRMLAAQNLVGACKDPDSGIVGLALGYLEGFGREDFNVSATDSLVVLFKKKTPHFDKLIRLIGFLELSQVRNDFREMAQSSASKKDRWSAMLALSRMGDAYASENIMSRVKKLPVNDDVVYQIFPDLIYTRQREAIGYLVAELGNDAKNCVSADAERDSKIPCAYRIMEMLAPAIADYPLKADPSGDIDTDDYAHALQTVRGWFKDNKDYKISKDTY